MASESRFNSQVDGILAALAGRPSEADEQLAEFHLRQDDFGHVIGDFYKCRLTSIFQPVFSTAARVVIGHQARVRCEGWGDDAVSPWGIFSMMAGDQALIRLDRLCRALHVLNYRARAKPASKLFLRVEPRLLQAVKGHHGRVFSEVLSLCNIDTSRIVIEIPAETTQEHELLITAARNYRELGYLVAVSCPNQGAWERLEDVKPDFVRIDVKRLNADQALDRIVALAKSWNGRVIAEKVESARELVVAARAPVDLLQGYFVGRPNAEFARWHGLAPVPHSVISAAIAGQVEATHRVNGR